MPYNKVAVLVCWSYSSVCLLALFAQFIHICLYPCSVRYMWDACDTLLWQWLSNRPFLLWGPRWSAVPLCSVMYWSTQTAFPNVLHRCSVCSNKPVPCVFMWRSLAHGSQNPNCCEDYFIHSCNDLVSGYQPELSNVKLSNRKKLLLPV